jgi:hypothetical protein
MSAWVHVARGLIAAGHGDNGKCIMAAPGLLSGLLAALLWPETDDVACIACAGRKVFGMGHDCIACGGRGLVSVPHASVTT